MRITVEYLAQVKQTAGVSSEILELPDAATLRDVLPRIAERHGDALRRILFDDAGNSRPSLLFFIGDRQVRGQQAVELRDGDRLTIMSPIAGG